MAKKNVMKKEEIVDAAFEVVSTAEEQTAVAKEEETYTIKKCMQIPVEELKAIVELRSKLESASNEAAQAQQKAQMLELEFKNTVQQVFLNHSLLPNCKVDQNTGVVTWPESV